MAKLIRELSARFPKARILDHRDLPGVHEACPCYDVAKDQNGEKASQSLKNLPQIRGRPSPGRNIMPQIQGMISWSRNIFPQNGSIFLRGQKKPLRSKACFFEVGMSSLQTGSHFSDVGMSSFRFEAASQK